MRYSLRYGVGSLVLDTGDIVMTSQVVPRMLENGPDDSVLVLSALDRPIKTGPLRDYVSGDTSVSIIIDGPELSTETAPVLKHVIDILRSASIRPETMNIVVSRYYDSGFDETEIDKFLENPLKLGINIELHNPFNEKQLVFVGETPTFSTPVSINQTFAHSDVKIAISSIHPDPFIGASGGRMSILPGVSGYKTINKNMRLRTKTNGTFYDIECRASLDMIEAAKMAGLDYIVNTVHDYKGNTVDVVAGNMVAAWKKGVSTSKDISICRKSDRGDIVVISPGGSPYDSTLYRAIDCLPTACRLTRQQGAIVLVAECTEGTGPDGFEKGISESESTSELHTRIISDFQIGMEKAMMFLRVIGSRKLIICSRLRSSLVFEKLRSVAVKDPQEGLEIARNHVGRRSDVTIVPFGNSTVVSPK